MPGFYTNTLGNTGIAGTETNRGGALGITSQMRSYDPTELSQAQLMEAQRAQMPEQLGIQKELAQNQLQQTADKSARFNAVMGALSGQLGKLNGGVYTAGGQNTAPPPITAGPVYNSQQMQQMQNQNAAQLQQGAAGQDARTSASLAGRGFGANSPLAMALQSANQANTRGQVAGTNTQLGLSAAQANAGQLLNSQQALSNQWATGNQLDIQRRTPLIQQQTAILQALAGLV
jgi:hypothetical protein